MALDTRNNDTVFHREKIDEAFRFSLADHLPVCRTGKAFYPDGPFRGKLSCQSAHLNTEADLRLHLGSWLQHSLDPEHQTYSIHAETKVYGSLSRSADLTIHQIEENPFWTDKDNKLDSLIALIEAKLANVKEPLCDFVDGSVARDIRKLSCLNSDILP